MRNLFIIAILFFFISCAAPKFDVESRTADYFDEWGLLRFTGNNVLSSGSRNVASEDVKPDDLCNTLFGKIGFYGSRLYIDDFTKKLSIECLSLEPPIKSDFSEDMLLNQILKTHFIWIKNDSLYYVLYGGDKISFQSEENLHHRLICQEKRIDSCHLDEKFEMQRYYIYFDGPFYELTIPANRSFYSITIMTDHKKINGYKPIKIDPSLLPLESPGYKKLREQEEALSKQ